jgi:basic membrane lipoprotein Med (substrate-binding protein (PBP1-ABC) superfamily)
MTMRRPLRSRAFLVSVLAVVALIAAACGEESKTTPGSQPEPELIVGAVHVGSVDDAGYNQAQHEGLMAMKDAIDGIEVIEAENVPEGPDVTKVMQNMINEGATLVFPQSFGYMDFALDLAKQNPGVIFEHPAGYKVSDNFGNYWAASDQLHYALGAGAGMMTESDKIGFIGAMPIPQVIYSINAYHLGARSVNPDVTTTVIFTGSWSDPGKEASATSSLADRGVDVIASLVDSPITVVQTSEQRDVWAIGYHSAAAAEFAPTKWLSGVDFNWAPLFTKYAQQVIDGTWEPTFDRPGVEEGVATLAPFGPDIPMDVQDTMNGVVDDFIGGDLKSPLQGPVYDQDGKLRIPEGKVPSPDLTNEIDWFAEGIIGQTQ